MSAIKQLLNDLLVSWLAVPPEQQAAILQGNALLRLPLANAPQQPGTWKGLWGDCYYKVLDQNGTWPSVAGTYSWELRQEGALIGSGLANSCLDAFQQMYELVFRDETC